MSVVCRDCLLIDAWPLDGDTSFVVLLFAASLFVKATVVLFFVFSFFNFNLTTFSVNSLQLLLSCAAVLHSPPTSFASLLTQSSHRSLGFPRLPFLHFLDVWSLPVFISRSFHVTGPFQHTPHQFLLNTSLRSNLCSVLSSDPLSSLPRFFCSSCFHKSAWSTYLINL